MKSSSVKQAITDKEIESCFSVMAELRPHLVKNEFIKLIRELEQLAYNLLYLENEGEIVCVAGYRISKSLFMGKNLYVDDLVTSEKARSQGHGEKMMDHLRAIAHESKCEYFHLDSGTQRPQAHKFYFRQNLSIASFHFSEKIHEAR